MPTILFWLLDINHEIVDDTIEVRLWGKDENGNTILLTTSNVPYFYLLPKEGEDAEIILKELYQSQTMHREIVQVELVDKKYFGKSVKVIRVRCKTLEAAEKYSKLLSKMPSIKERLEDDIRPATRYIIENNVSPSGWYKIEVSKTSGTDLVYKNVCTINRQPEHIDKFENPKFKMLALAILCFSSKGSPDPEEDPISAITIASNVGGIEQLISSGKDDRHLLERFVAKVQEIDPDIIVGYNQNFLDWPYLIERSRRHKIKLSLDRSGAEPHRSVYGHISVIGRANIDLANVLDDIPEVKVKTLGSMAEFLQVAKKNDIDKFENIETGEFWGDNEKRKTLLDYTRMRSDVSLKIGELLLDSTIQMSHVTGLPLDQVAAAAVGFRVDSYLMMQAYRLDELIPRRTEQPYIRYQGAIVIEPKPGIHENIAVLDFTSMYPNLMIMNNLSPDTFVGKENLPEIEVVTAPEVGFRFRKKPPGFYKRVLENLIAARREIKKKMNQADPKSVEYRVLAEREKAIKVVTNACYGYAGWVGARWYVREVAESASAFGRATLRNVFKLAEMLGLPLIYADTDSIFVEYDRAKVRKLLDKVETDMGMKIKIDKVYSRALFTEAKKKYAGLLSDGSLDIVGLEVVRGDWSNVAKTVQEKVLDIILKENAAQKAVVYVRDVIRDLRLGKVPTSDLVIWKTLTKPVESYQVKAPHVEAAKSLLREGWRFKVGDKVGYVITKGSGRLYERVKPYTMASPNEIDFEYYVTNQVLPAAMRVLGMFNVDENTIIGGSASALSDYMS